MKKIIIGVLITAILLTLISSVGIFAESEYQQIQTNEEQPANNVDSDTNTIPAEQSENVKADGQTEEQEKAEAKEEIKTEAEAETQTETQTETKTDTGDEKNEEVIDYEIRVTSRFASKEQLKKMPIGDKMKFSFTVLPEYKGVITHEVANVGETVKCELEHLINGNTEDIYILTMSGSRGEAKFWYNEYRSWGGSQTGNVQPMYFSFGWRIIDGDQVYCKYSDEKMRWPNMYIVSEFGGGKLTSVKFAFNMPLVHLVNGKIHLTDQREQAIENAAECFDTDYIVYSDEENSLADNFADRDKEQLIEDALAEAEKYDSEEQDPERYVTLVKGVSKSGRMFDYTVSFVAEMELDSVKNPSAWYSKLGDNVKFALVGLTETVDGDKRGDNILLRFSGDKGEKWFRRSREGWKTDEDGTITMEGSYKSLISFDGYEMIRNTLEYEVVNMDLKFSTPDDMFYSIDVDVDGRKLHFDTSKIKYIGE